MQVIDHVLLHVIFSTKGQKPVLKDDALRAAVHTAMREVLSRSLNVALAVGGAADHVHIALYLSRQMTVNKLVEHLKKAGVLAVRAYSVEFATFSFQKSYFAFSVDARNRDALVDHIRNETENQPAHSFPQEMRRFCVAYGIEIDERFVWK